MSLEETLSNILDTTISEDVMRNLQVEGITTKSLVFLKDADLKEIGFRMGERRLLLQCGHHSDSAPLESAGGHSHVETRTPPNLPSRIECNDMQDMPTTPTLRVQRLPRRFHISKDFPVDTINLSQQRQVNGPVSGHSLVKKLQDGDLPDRPERLFFIKVLGRYLMNNCSERDRPSTGEKEDMARSILKTFPVLHDGTHSGYGSIFDGTSYTGTLEYYIRSRRSNCHDIETLWAHSPKSCMIPPESSIVKESVRLLREQRPNIGNKQELLRLMDVTRSDRRGWIKHSSPSITKTKRRYPRLLDMPDAVREEFRHITGTNKQLHVEFQQYKQLILNLSGSKCELESILSGITDDLDEDRNSEVAFKCLVHLLPTPQKRSVKRPKLSLESVLDRFFVNFEEDTVDNGLAVQERKGVTQPMLLRINSKYYVKADNTAISVMDCCFAEAVEFLLMVFFVFQVEYPFELRVFYGFLEKIMDLKSSIKISVLTDMMRTLKKCHNPLKLCLKANCVHQC